MRKFKNGDFVHNNVFGNGKIIKFDTFYLVYFFKENAFLHNGGDAIRNGKAIIIGGAEVLICKK